MAKYKKDRNHDRYEQDHRHYGKKHEHHGQHGGMPYPPPADEECPPTAFGTCVPLALGAKPKQRVQGKLQAILARSPVPSALAASFFQLSRRFLSGKTAANPLEEAVFGVMQSLPPDLSRILSCSLDNFDNLSDAERERLYLSTLTDDVNTPIDPATLGEAVGQEIAQRTSQVIFGDPQAAEQERAGRNRFFDPTGGETFDVQLRICRVNGIRTLEFVPPISPGDFLPEELEQKCNPIVVGDHVEPNCENQVGNCEGNFLPGDVCLRVPPVKNGEAVVLEGVNFISLDIIARLTAKPPDPTTVDLETHVFGDLETPLTEILNGNEEIINDCRVHDRLTFVIPPELAPGVYTLRLVMPNVSGIPALGDPILSNEQFLRVLPPDTARFQISLEAMHAVDETSPAFFGSDEVGLNIVATTLLADGSSTPLQVLNNTEGKPGLRFGDVDSGEDRDIQRVVFSHEQTIIAMAMVINGYEIDSEDAFENEITTFNEALYDILKKEWDIIKDLINTAGGVEKLKDLGLTALIVIGIAAAILFAIDLIYAAWAPADPIMHDTIGLTSSGLAELLNADLPMPSPTEFDVEDGIHVKVAPQFKLPQQYTEQRQYESDPEGSTYQLDFRYNRLA